MLEMRSYSVMKQEWNCILISEDLSGKLNDPHHMTKTVTFEGKSLMLWKYIKSDGSRTLKLKVT